MTAGAATPALLASRRGGRAPLALAASAILVALAVNLPLVYLLVRSSEAGLAAWAAEVTAPRTLRLLGETLLLLGGVLPVALLLAVGQAWLVARTDLPGRRVWAVAAALPLVIPSYVAAFSLVAVLGPRGFLQGRLAAFGIERLPELAYGYTGALIALAPYTAPYVFLPVLAAMSRLDPALEESARTLGAGPVAAFRRAVLPQLRGPLLVGGLLVALYTLSDFGAVSLTRYNTLTLGIYGAYAGLFDRGVAASLATLLVAATLVLVGIEALLRRRVRRPPARPARPQRRVALGAFKLPCLALLCALHLVVLGMPVGVTLFWAARALRVGNPLGSAWAAAASSLAVSLLAALVAVALAVPVAWWAQRWPSRASRLTERLAYSGFALPGLVIALALVFFATRWLPAVYQTIGLLVAAYVVRFLPEAVSAVHAALAGIPPALEEAARGLGRGPFGVLRELTLVLIRPGLLAGAGLVFMTSMKELPATLLLRPVGFETLATRIWSAAGEGVFSEAAIPTLCLLAASAVPVAFVVVRPLLAERT